jgi:hypothetical protein
VLLVDEILAVGDEAFARKCADRFAEFRRVGKTMMLVTHDAAAIERWCDEAIWLDHGVIRASGPPRKVVDLYRQAVAEEESDTLARVYAQPGATEPVAETASDAVDRWGSREIEIERVRLEDRDGAERYVFTTGEPVTIRLTYRVHRSVPSRVFGFAVIRNDGLWVYGTNTALAGVPVPDLGRTGEVAVSIETLDLIAGSYFVDVAAHAEDGAPYDYHSRRYPFSVRGDDADRGVVKVHHRWRISPGAA